MLVLVSDVREMLVGRACRPQVPARRGSGCCVAVPGRPKRRRRLGPGRPVAHIQVRESVSDCCRFGSARTLQFRRDNFYFFKLFSIFRLSRWFDFKGDHYS